ncbi:MAG: TRAP transporter substrate-binding protein DctP [Clostridiales bacterium]|nr:TRAP transporter substrate-binding protein DctP [Clostridiales bacterium]
MKRKKVLAICLTAMMGAMLGLSACGSSSDSSSSTATADTTDTGSAAEESASVSSAAADGTDYNLTFSMHTAADSTYGNLLQELFDDISADTDGHVNIQIYGSATLAAGADVADMITDGGVDLGWIFAGFYTGQYSLSEVISTPLMETSTMYETTEVLWDLYENYPEMAAEWDDYYILMMYANPVNYIYTNTEVSSLADLQGMTIRTVSGIINDALLDYGCNPTTIAPNDIYDSMSKNTIQAFMVEPTVIEDYTLGEVASYEVKIPIYQSTFVVAINKDVYNSLPAEYQAVLDSYATREYSLEYAAQMDEYVQEIEDNFVAGGGTVVEISDEDIAELQAYVDPYVDSWIEENTTDDFDAQSYYDFAMSKFAEYE